ncbi:MAG: hypothetical protein VCB25_08415 [Myxococcota bacterium]
MALIAAVIGSSSCFVLSPVARAVVDDLSPAFVGWERLRSLGGGGEKAVAFSQSDRGEMAVADNAGVSWWRDDGHQRAVLPSIRDLAFSSDGVLWIATSRGLFSWNRNGRPAAKRLSGGETGNQVEQIAISDSLFLLATAAGAVWSTDGQNFSPLRDFAAAGAITHVAIRPKRWRRGDWTGAPMIDTGEAWLYGPGRLLVIRASAFDRGGRVTQFRISSVSLPRSGLGEGEAIVDLLIDPAGKRLLFVSEGSIAWRSLEDESSASTASVFSRWRFVRPTLPPGASIRGLGWATGRVWIATNHGLLAGDTIDGPFRRAASPVGTTSCVDVQAGARDQVFALCRSGLFALSKFLAPDFSGTGEIATISGTSSLIRLLPDPPLPEIRRRALRRAGLTVRRAQRMWNRLGRRAYWPDLELRFDLEFDFDREREFDQAFISGERRDLFDRTFETGRSYSAVIELDWELGEIVYPLETIDLSRELRQLVTLRDDVSDEINQLYFERQAIREKLAAFGRTDLKESIRLSWRAREIDAGLDAWTGGWISHWRSLRLKSTGRAGSSEGGDRSESNSVQDSTGREKHERYLGSRCFL